MDFDGEPMKIRKKKKTKLYKTLEEGDLLFNLILAIWFFILSIVFGGIFEIFFSYKIAMLASYFTVSAFLINLIFKIVDIYRIYSQDPFAKRVQIYANPRAT